MLVLWFAFFVLPSSGSKLLSRHKTTVYQSVIGHGGVPGRAVDSVYHQIWTHNSCTATWETEEYNNWWLLDLGERAHIVSIKIWNRLDCCQERLNGAKVLVDGVQVGQLWNSQLTYSLTTDVIGRYVKVSQENGEILTLCEVEVWGEFTGNPGVGPNYFHYPILVSHNRPTTASSGSSNSNTAVDGIFWGHHAVAKDGTCASAVVDTSHQSWWQVVLHKDHIVSLIVLYPNIAGEQSLYGARVFVDDILCGTYPNDNERRHFYAMKCPLGGLIGSRIKVTKSGSNFNLCEAQVFGAISDPPTEAPTTLPICADNADECPVLARQQKCNEPGNLRKCPHSCHQCSCGDNFRSCEKMKETGHCSNNPRFMSVHCKKSCGLCKCVDSLPRCSERAAQGQCINDPSFRVQCPLSCNQCQCGDNLHNCQALALAGDCVRYPAHMLVHCAKSCNQCGSCADNAPFSNQCAARAARGECETNGNMAVHCAASCKLCEEEEEERGDLTDDEYPWI